MENVDPGLAAQPDQLAPSRLIEPSIRRVCDVLFHYRGINGDPLKAVTFHHTSALPGLDGLGQHPFDTFLADPISPARQG